MLRFAAASAPRVLLARSAQAARASGILRAHGALVRARRHVPALGPRFVHSSTAAREIILPPGASTKSGGGAAESAGKQEVVTGQGTKHAFEAETHQLLRIVANALYSDKSVFVRELVSNASDALEKLKHEQMIGTQIADPELSLKIDITVDEEAGTFTISDTGIGMTKDELISNLGTIARSGSRAFLKQLQDSGQTSDASSSIIGQFGVGFYSGFMVGDHIKVYSRSGKDPNAPGHVWQSDGSGEYEVAEAANVQRGTKIVIELKKEEKEFSRKEAIEDMIHRYSSFVGYPIHVNGDNINTIKALWLEPADRISEEEHTEFYRFVSSAFDAPRYTLHYSVDAPLQMRSLLYIPSFHTENLTGSRMEPGVHLYCRKVLIKSKMKNLLPEWMRFVRGVIDSEDIPLNLSRELLQDSALVGRLGRLVASRVIRFLEEKSRTDTEGFLEFYGMFSNFLREGICTDRANKSEILKLMHYESSKEEPGKLVSLKAYVDRMPADQKEIYYLCAPSRQLAEMSPYLDSIVEAGNEVLLFMYEPLDDFIMTNEVDKFGDKKFVSVESSEIAIKRREPKSEGEKDAAPAMDAAAQADFFSWMRDTLGSEKIATLKPSERLVKHPAIITDHESSHMRKMMKMIDKDRVKQLGPQTVEINLSHPLVIGLNEMRATNPERARIVAEQLYDNALVAAGMIDDPRDMLERLNTILVDLVRAK